MHKNIENHAILLYCKNETPFTQIKMGSAMCAAPTRTSNKTHATWATSRTSNPKPDSPSGAKTVATNVAENVLPEATALPVQTYVTANSIAYSLESPYCV